MLGHVDDIMEIMKKVRSQILKKETSQKMFEKYYFLENHPF